MLRVEHNYAAKDWLRDGRPVIVRAIKDTDKELLQQIMKDVSAESRYNRFLCAKKILTASELRYFTEIDFDKHIGLIVSLCDEAGEHPIAVGRYIAIAHGAGGHSGGADGCANGDDQGVNGGDHGGANGGSAELALLVGEAYQRQGIGSILLNHLANIALTKGVSEFVCYIMPENRKMLNFLRDSKYPVVRRPEPGSIVHMTVGLKGEAQSA
jgi:GNAT superfamily N-acetyltransferase